MVVGGAGLPDPPLRLNRLLIGEVSLPASRGLEDPLRIGRKALKGRGLKEKGESGREGALLRGGVA